VGSLSKLMQKLDELELPPGIQSNANAPDAKDKDAQQSPDATNADDPTLDELEAAEELAVMNEAESDTPAQADAGSGVVDVPAGIHSDSDAQAESVETAQPEAEPIANDQTGDDEALIPAADVEALLAEHGPESESTATSNFVQDPEESPPADDEIITDRTPMFEPDPDPAAMGNELPDQADRDPAAEFRPVKPNAPAITDSAIAAVADGQTAPWDVEKVDPAVIAYHNRYAALCEQYRSLRARIFSMNPSGQHQIITVTSSVPEEGKSVTTMNLSICVAESSHHRVLVIDADFRRASLARMVGARHNPGTAELVLGEARLEDVIQHTPYPNMKLMSAGKLGASSYGELLASPQIRTVFEQLRQHFSYIFLDTPPVTTVSDVSMLAPLTDGALMVVEMGRTPEPTVQLAVRTLQTNNVNVLGCVLSRYRDQRKHYYDRYYDYYDRH
jgi:capsular exopolysaccharide synthesis family protein